MEDLDAPLQKNVLAHAFGYFGQDLYDVAVLLFALVGILLCRLSFVDHLKDLENLESQVDEQFKDVLLAGFEDGLGPWLLANSVEVSVAIKVKESADVGDKVFFDELFEIVFELAVELSHEGFYERHRLSKPAADHAEQCNKRIDLALLELQYEVVLSRSLVVDLHQVSGVKLLEKRVCLGLDVRNDLVGKLCESVLVCKVDLIVG